MITGKEITKTITTIERTYYCDFCGNDLAKQNPTSYDRNEATIEALEGEYFPEGDCRTRYNIDVCVECFLDKVKPAIEALGVKFREGSADDRYYKHVDKMGMT